MSVHTIISSGTYIIAKGAMSQFAPLVFGFYRFCLATVAMAIIILFRPQYLNFGKSQWPFLVFLGILAIPINQCFFLYGLDYTLPTHSALLYATTPVWVYLLSVWRKEEKITRGKTIGLFIALAGVVAFFMEKGLSLNMTYFFGDSLIMMAVWAWAIYTVLGRPLVREKGAFAVTSTTLILGSVIYFPLGLYLASRFDYSKVGWAGWGAVAYTALLTSVLSYTIWYWCIKYREPSRTAVFVNLQPVLTAILAYFLLGERLTVASLISGLIILIGVFVVQKYPSAA